MALTENVFLAANPAEATAFGLNWCRFPLPELTPEVTIPDTALALNLIVELLSDLPEEPALDDYFPVNFARRVAALVHRYPTLRYFTPVLRPFALARGTADFVKTTGLLARSAILSRKAIEAESAEAPLFFLHEDLQLYLAMPGSGREGEAHALNQQRFLALDLLFGHRDPATKAMALEGGLTEAAYEWFIAHGSNKETIFSLDVLAGTIRELWGNRTVTRDKADFSVLWRLVEEYWERYPLPLLVSIDTRHSQALYEALCRAHHQGRPVVGMGLLANHDGGMGSTGELLSALAAKGLSY